MRARTVTEYRETVDFIGRRVNVSGQLNRPLFPAELSIRGFFEMEWGLTGEFWRELKRLCQVHGDTAVSWASIDPGEDFYYRRNEGAYGAFTAPADANEEAFINLVAPSQRIGSEVVFAAWSFIYTCDEYVATGDSLKWALWAQRGYGIAALASIPSAPVKQWMAAIPLETDFDTAITRYVAPGFRGEPCLPACTDP